MHSAPTNSFTVPARVDNIGQAHILGPLLYLNMDHATKEPTHTAATLSDLTNLLNSASLSTSSTAPPKIDKAVPATPIRYEQWSPGIIRAFDFENRRWVYPMINEIITNNEGLLENLVAKYPGIRPDPAWSIIAVTTHHSPPRARPKNLPANEAFPNHGSSVPTVTSVTRGSRKPYPPGGLPSTLKDRAPRHRVVSNSYTRSSPLDRSLLPAGIHIESVTQLDPAHVILALEETCASPSVFFDIVKAFWKIGQLSAAIEIATAGCKGASGLRLTSPPLLTDRFLHLAWKHVVPPITHSLEAFLAANAPPPQCTISGMRTRFHGALACE